MRIYHFLYLFALSLFSMMSLASACPDIDGITDLNCDKKLVIVCFGDSITSGRGDSAGLGYPGRLKLLLPNAEIYNLGVPGENTYSGRNRAAVQFPTIPADYTIILQGVNDYWVSRPSAVTTRNNLLEIKAIAESFGSAAVIANLLPLNRTKQGPWVLEVNNAINPFTGINFFSLGKSVLSSDNIHPNGTGYQLMATRVRDFLQAVSLVNKPADLDSDGVYDIAEPFYGTDPTLWDTDGDGISDGDEIFKYGTDPLKVDTDGDGFSDYDEIFVLGSDSLDPRPKAPVIKSIKVMPLE
jgi:lysophospholipase L1-like esterase